MSSGEDTSSDNGDEAEPIDDRVGAPVSVMPDSDPSVVLAEPDVPPPDSVPRPQAFKSMTAVPAAEISDVSPTAGPVIGGTKLVLAGKNLFRQSIVRIDNCIARTIGAREPFELIVSVPERDKPGSVDISIQNPGSDMMVLENVFRYEALPAPKIETVAPNFASSDGGTELAISGDNFVEGAKVLLNGSSVAPVKYVDAGTLEVKVPAGEAGDMIDVAVENPDGKRDTIRRAFKYS